MKDYIDINDIISDPASGSEAYVERPIAGRVFFIMLFAISFIALVVVFRLIFLNIAQADFYDRRSSINANKAIVLPALRGVITDRYGDILAKNAETFSVFLDSGQILKEREKLDYIVMRLAKTLKVEEEFLRSAIANTDFERSNTVALMRNISAEQAIAIKGLGLEEVSVVNDFKREYIDPEVFAHVIGYTGLSQINNDVVGKTGLEHYYDEYLRGEDGLMLIYRDALGQELGQHTDDEAVAGAKIETSIDADLQRYFYERLQQGLRELGVSAGVGLAIDPQTGEVLSLISLPSFDNNIFSRAGNGEAIADLFADKRQPLFNRVVSGAYNPGSTIKPLVALAALKEGVADDVFGVESKGYIEIPNPYNPSNPSRFVDWKAHGWVNVRSALARSSNIYFYVVGGGFEDLVGLGIKRLKDYWSLFGFGEPTGIDLAFESEGFLPSPEEKEVRTGQPWRVGDTYNVSIGQGDLTVSPLQLLSFTASIGNGGKIMRPYLMKSIQPVEGREEKQSAQLSFDYSDWEFELTEVRAGLEQAVSKEYGTAHLLSSLEMTSAGKTGSAQIQNNTKTNAFFVGYAPAENPSIAILVLVEDAKEGSLNTVPVVYDVLDWYYQNRLKEE
ncbi:MAG: penicillin-binding protein 2 [Candidatus Harrisonbacteria bacterium]|nr:penicillin-binding protein 2 [Candidatus Harrisonbacteria bacterium]